MWRFAIAAYAAPAPTRGKDKEEQKSQYTPYVGISGRLTKSLSGFFNHQAY
jgi:hypothetical protein